MSVFSSPFKAPFHDPFGSTFNNPGVGGGWSPLSLFAAGEQSAWYDPSDFSTMFQDSAGTTPVTAAGQPVGKILDKSGCGNHATQTTAASRPVLQLVSGKYALVFDGIDDFLVTNSIDFTATDKMTVFAGLANTGVATDRVFVELSSIYTNPGAFALIANGTAADRWFFGLTGSTTAFYANPHTNPVPAVLSVSLDIAGAARADEIKPRINGVAGQFNPSPATSAGTGNFGNYPLYIGRRAGTSAPFNGYFCQLVIRGAATDAAGVAAGETYTNSKTGAY